MKAKEEILEEAAAQGAIQRNMKVFILLLVVGNVLMLLHVGQLLYARFVKFPETAFLGTVDAQAVCAPIGLDEPMVADAVARDFAVEAIRAISTYDWTSWRDQINSSTAYYMTLDARNSYRISVNDWGIIRDVVDRYQNATAQQRGPATIMQQGVVPQRDGTSRYEWEIVVPMTMIYRNSTDRRSENRDFYAKVVRTPKSPLNPKAIAIGGLVSTQPVQTNPAFSRPSPVEALQSNARQGAPAETGAGATQ